jgi:anti-sigma factor RsiW
MIDCPNLGVRDRLADLAKDTLGPADRELVLVHLTECAACAAEIEILRTTRLILLKSTPKVNVQGIALALPRYGVPSIAGAPSRRAWSNSWRIAAAVTFLAAGFGSYELLNNDSAPRFQDTITASVAHDSTVGLALTGALADMSDAELRDLVGDIETIEALPSTEVEAMSSVGVPAILPDSVVRELEVR